MIDYYSTVKTIKECPIESRITPNFLQRSWALIAFALSLMRPSFVSKARSSAASSQHKASSRVPLSLTLVKQVHEYFSRVTNYISSDSIDHNASDGAASLESSVVYQVSRAVEP